MKIPVGSTPLARRGERGSAQLRFIIVLVIVVVVAYMGFQYVPVAYHAYTFKRAMDDTVENAANSTVPMDQKSQWVADQLKARANEYGVPPTAKIVPLFQNGRVEVTVQFTQPVNLLPGFTYQYNFDYTAKSNTFLTAH